ncbi:MAG: glycosyltransferase family 4 protein [Acidiferrobacterales bacterium]
MAGNVLASRVMLYYRKLRATGNFSMEASFDCMIEHFPPDSMFHLHKYVLTHYSSGLLPRIQGMLEAWRERGDINHVTGDVHYIALALPGRRTALTIHDCVMMRHPNPVARRILKWLWLDWPVRHCRYVTTVSNATREEVIRYTGCPPDKVVVIPTLIARHFDAATRPFNEDCPTILHVGLAHNKNFGRHVAAIAGLDCRLHVIGKLEPQHLELLAQHHIQYTSEFNLSMEDMHHAYRNCDMILFASTFEGFGMPIVEAQSVGRPVVTANISSMPEVAGDGACLVDPFSIDDIRKGVLRIIRERGYRETLVKRGFQNIRRFDPHVVAQQYEELYRRIAAS